MGIFRIGMVVQISTLFLHIIWLWILVYFFGLGLLGAGIAMSITFGSTLILIILYIHFYPHDDLYPECIQPIFKSDSFKDWWVYLKLGVPSAAMLCFEWFAFEFIAIFAGYSGIFDLAAYIAMFNFLQVMFQTPYGMGQSISTLCGQAIGSGKPFLA